MAGIVQALIAGFGAVKDAYFNYVTLLLHGDGTNAAQNNTFLDSSSNNFTITRNGNTTQGTFTPFSQSPGYWGNYFKTGNTDYLTTPSISLTGNFTIECWINFPSIVATYNPVVGGASGVTQIFLTTKSDGTGLRYGLTGVAEYGSAAFAWTAGVWYHVALVRSGTSVKFYLNGVDVTSTSTADATAYSGAIAIAAVSGLANTTNAYISNVRIATIAVYTSNFTPSTTPLTAISGTSLLTCQSNRFVDNSTNNFSITTSGSPNVLPFNPFAPTGTYSTSVNGGSGYFDGSGDYVTAPSNAAFAYGTGDFSIECWVYFNTTARGGGPSGELIGGDTAGNAVMLVNPTNIKLSTYATADDLTASYTFVVNQWYHLVACRTSGTGALFVNGVRVASGSVTRNYNQGGFQVFSGTNGYLCDIRVVKGSNPYGTGATCTVPTAPLTAITNTSLLLSCTNAGILDNSMKNDLETVGNAQISTSVKKYGTGSMAFDGNGDYLNGANALMAVSGSTSYTLEMWVYPTSVAGDLCLYETRGGSGFVFFINSTGNLQVYDSAAGLQTASSTALTANVWTHIALVRASGSSTNTYYIGGVASGTFALASFSSATQIRIGARNDGAAAYVGYIDDLRVTKGIARYTANFTPPTAAFPNQ